MPDKEDVGIPGYQVNKIPGVRVIGMLDHSDDRRDIYTLFNSAATEFQPGQVKVLVTKDDCWLGGKEGHYHEYPESYFMLGRGRVTFYLQAVDHPHLYGKIDLYEGQRIYIPARVAHKVQAEPDIVLVGLTEKPYTGSDQDKPFAIQTSTPE
jgi:mannose-6-phosphate isomerase-like protein (cupin superfamily)